MLSDDPVPDSPVSDDSLDLPTTQWDNWCASAEESTRRARAVAAGAAASPLLAGVIAGVALPHRWLLVAVVAVPAALCLGWGGHRLATVRGFRETAAAVRLVIRPRLVSVPTDPEIRHLLKHGGAQFTRESKVIRVQRLDQPTVRLHVRKWDMTSIAEYFISSV